MNDTFVFSSVLDQPEILPVSYLNEYRTGVQGFGEMNLGIKPTALISRIEKLRPTRPLETSQLSA